MKVAILNDITKCIGCGACVLACQEANDLSPQEDPPKLSDRAWTRIKRVQGANIRQQCMHCLDPTCVSVCPVRALEKTEEGPVTYHADRCIGCRYCMQACPFNIPKYEWGSAAPKVRKCIMCYESRVSAGLSPACTEACPTGATKFGDREELIAEARARIADDPDRYVDHIYGVEEAGGTSVLYLSHVPFEELGFRTNIPDEPLPHLTWEILSKVPDVVGIGGVFLFGSYWVIRRRMMMEKLERSGVSPEDGPPLVHSDEGSSEVER